MEREVNNFKIVAAQPTDFYFLPQIHVYVESCIENGWKEEDIDILLIMIQDRNILILFMEYTYIMIILNHFSKTNKDNECC